ncbi:hypothetical protein HD806DRAFT_500963 [Xylariaceae sp. AK1471]|nr:hypothetical protein HD806DRAFT_500963 [Xylariaceae sp. AK1471]
MQGDIFQVDVLATQVAVPKPQPAVARPKSTSNNAPQVAIYNEDDLSHLLYVNNHPHHHHHHHEQKSFTHPADAGTVLINTVELSDCESWSGSDSESESSGEVESPLTPPLSLSSNFEDPDQEALDAYRRKGRRNAFSVASEDGFEFPVFLGRQAEEWPPMPRSLPSLHSSPALATSAPAVNTETETESSQHVQVGATSGPMMSWWPEPLGAMEDNWTDEEMEWVLETEKEKLIAREREGRIVEKTNYESHHVGTIAGPLMSWWPTPLEEYDWNERFYE